MLALQYWLIVLLPSSLPHFAVDHATFIRIARTPLRRQDELGDIGGIAAFLAGPWARFITGQVIDADGGATIVGA